MLPTTSYPSTAARVGSALIHFLGVSILTHCFSRRLALERIPTWTSILHVPWPRICLLLVFIDSWLFLFSSGILIFGVGLDVEESICEAGIHFCIIFYSTSKFLIYAFLIERVYIVWSTATIVGRFQSRVYIICLITVCTYGAVILSMFVGRVHYFREGDRACVIGLKVFSSLPLLSYDLYMNVFLTGLFLWPLMRRGTSMDDRVKSNKSITQRALVASTVALTTSTVNIAILASMRGQQLGWVCLGSCGVDVIINAYSLYWASGSRRRRGKPPSIPSGIVSRDLSQLTQSQGPSPQDPFTYPTFQPPTPLPTVHVSAGQPETPPISAFDRLFWWTKMDNSNDAEAQRSMPASIEIMVTTHSSVIETHDDDDERPRTSSV
ncbi:hypothetical protein CYLTODRAFT_426897 [Cylindrobasidium torrendii FP15055 ss-10]|uniref:G-protein coupled receptors family 1 profile domain-containing protein n=1 Tax=Cylindrobasidium torrendii FP15055 ss-10 TaxID=1314674 RepID=A0A0D7AW73_9AGAR|nr:hypothetical protein CYLTODRAFT_426897 [Cylindrobasidium torrendii FP15055 ss-10]